MSVVVVVKKSGRAVIASDSQTSFGTTVLRPPFDAAPRKIHKVNDAFVGLVGSSAHQNVFASLVEKHPGDFSFQSSRHLFETALKMHHNLKEHFYLLTRENKDQQEYESSQIDCLVAAPAGIFGLYSYREVHEFGRFWAIGSGNRFALGAMFAAYEQMDSPEEIARIGVAAAIELEDGCSSPIAMESVPLNPKA
jgi:ATP-dependent HslUV protease subunit HslV